MKFMANNFEIPENKLIKANLEFIGIFSPGLNLKTLNMSRGFLNFCGADGGTRTPMVAR